MKGRRSAYQVRSPKERAATSYQPRSPVRSPKKGSQSPKRSFKSVAESAKKSVRHKLKHRGTLITFKNPSSGATMLHEKSKVARTNWTGTLKGANQEVKKMNTKANWDKIRPKEKNRSQMTFAELVEERRRQHANDPDVLAAKVVATEKEIVIEVCGVPCMTAPAALVPGVAKRGWGRRAGRAPPGSRRARGGAGVCV